MSRYVYTATRVDTGECIDYAESAREEDADCENPDIEFAGPGYLHFWERCMEQCAETAKKVGVPIRAVIEDRDFDMEKVIAGPLKDPHPALS